MRWSSETNEILGLCYNHKNQVNSFIFDSWLNLTEVKKKLSNGEINLAKETLFVSISKVSKNDNSSKVLNFLKLFDQKLVLGKCGVNFDPKQLGERLRGIIISETREIVLVKRAFNKSHLKELLNEHKNLTSLLNPKDYQMFQ